MADFVAKAKTLKLGDGFKPDTTLGPVISPEAKLRIEGIISRAAGQGAVVALDGRGVVVQGYEKGNFVGPTGKENYSVYLKINFSIVITNVKPSMECYKEEIFGKSFRGKKLKSV